MAALKPNRALRIICTECFAGAVILFFAAVAFGVEPEKEFGPEEELPSSNSVVTNASGLKLLTSVDDVRRLKREEAQLGYPVKLRGVVTCVVQYQNGFIVQDAAHAIYVVNSGKTNNLPRAGNLIEVEGKTDKGSFAPLVRAGQIHFLGDGKFPEPMRPAWDQLMNGSMGDQWVEIRGVVDRAVSHPAGYTNNWSRMMLRTQGGTLWVDLQTLGMKLGNLESYENALVRIRGCMFVVLNQITHQLELGHIRIYANEIIVEEPAPKDLFSVPRRSAEELMQFDPQARTFQRVKVSGQLIYIRSTNYFMMDGTNGVRFVPKETGGFGVGDLVDVVGYPELNGAAPLLSEAVVRKIGQQSLPPPKNLSPMDLPAAANDSTLVRIEGILASVRSSVTNQIFEIQAGSWRFLARLELKSRKADDFAHSLRTGSRLSLEGVYAAQGGNRFAGDDIAPFDLLLRSPDDIKILSQPPWWTLKKLLAAVGLLACLLIGTGLWITQLHRQVDERTEQLKTQIQERQRIENQNVMQQERARIAQDLHDELGSSITEISMLAARTKSSASENNRGEYLQQMDDKAHEMVGTLDEIVWATNPAHDSLSSLVSYFCLYAERFLGLANIAWQMDDQTGAFHYAVSSQNRHQLFLAFKEALNNIVRHSSATDVKLKIQIEQEELQLTIADNGRGISPIERSAVADGLTNMRTRLEKMGGRFEISSEAGHGTVLQFSLPVNQTL